MIEEFTAIRWRVRELTRVRDLASSHKLEQMRRVRVLEKQAAWKREGGFDRVESIAEMHEQTLRRLHAGFDLESLYTGLYNPRWPPTFEEFTRGHERQGREIEARSSTFTATTAATI